jgi:hypothetical protein
MSNVFKNLVGTLDTRNDFYLLDIGIRICTLVKFTTLLFCNSLYFNAFIGNEQ